MVPWIYHISSSSAIFALLTCVPNTQTTLHVTPVAIGVQQCGLTIGSITVLAYKLLCSCQLVILAVGVK